LVFARNTVTADCVIQAIKDLDKAAYKDRRRVDVFLLIDTTGSAAFNRQLPPLRSFLHRVKQVDPTHYDLPSPSELKAINLIFKTYHRYVLGTLHGKQVLVDGELAMVGSKNIDADLPEEIMVILKGRSFVKACLEDFESVWEEKVPTIEFITEEDRQEQVPIVMMGRTDVGSPLSVDWESPQNVAWRSMMDVAKKEVYIQTMLFNAEPLFDKVLETVKRGVNVTMVVTYKYGDLALRLDKRGLGHNRGAVSKLYASLAKFPLARKRLRVCWWIGKRPTKNGGKPIPTEKDFTHAKAVIVDQKLVALGSANMDAMSVYNQREANFMIDDEQVAKQVYERLREDQLSLDNCYHFYN